MGDWFQILREQLQLAHIATPDAPVPFGIGGIASAAWRVAAMERVGSSEHVLTAHTDDGAEVQWHMRFYADTRAAECWGVLTNRGSRPLSNLSEFLTWDLDLQPAFDEPWGRRVNGVRFLANYLPPHDFAPVDYQRPTGQPSSADEYAQVIFSDGGRSVTMEFNADSPGSASLNMT